VAHCASRRAAGCRRFSRAVEAAADNWRLLVSLPEPSDCAYACARSRDGTTNRRGLGSDGPSGLLVPRFARIEVTRSDNALYGVAGPTAVSCTVDGDPGYN
jgi:hypothetical protein